MSDYVTVKAEVRVDRELYDYLKDGGVDFPILLQGFMNELNGYFHETRSIYENLAGVETDQVLMRMIQMYREGKKKSEELRRRVQRREEVLRSRREP